MKTATISQTKNNLSALLDRVRHGETILILDRNQPVARVVPIESASGKESDDARLQRLERAGLLRRGSGRMAPDVLRKRRAVLKPGRDAVKASIEERRSGW